MKRAAAFALAAAIMFSFSACKIGGSKGANKTINYSLSAEPATLDPQIATDESSVTVVQALFEGLTRLDANLTPSRVSLLPGNTIQTAHSLRSICGQMQNGHLKSMALLLQMILFTHSSGHSTPKQALPPARRCTA